MKPAYITYLLKNEFNSISSVLWSFRAQRASLTEHAESKLHTEEANDLCIAAPSLSQHKFTHNGLNGHLPVSNTFMMENMPGFQLFGVLQLPCLQLISSPFAQISLMGIGYKRGNIINSQLCPRLTGFQVCFAPLCFF